MNDKRVFEEIARRITTKAHTNVRRFFWIMCLISTLSAALIEDLSVAVIFIPVVISTCHKMNVNPTPFLLGITICINLASTLTPFGSAENILIAAGFNLSTWWFIQNFGLYFVGATLLTLFLLDQIVLKKEFTKYYLPGCVDDEEAPEGGEAVKRARASALAAGKDDKDGKDNKDEKGKKGKRHEKDEKTGKYEKGKKSVALEEEEMIILERPADPREFKKNLVGLLVFVVLLFVVPNILLSGLIGLMIFVFLNPREDAEGTKRPAISYYFAKVDYKLVYFFICLFILVFCMEVNGTLDALKHFIQTTAPGDVFLLSLVILGTTSLLSGLLDNVPVTVIFIPLIQSLIADAGHFGVPLLIAFILGINLGGNFLPQGAACDMMTLELAKKNCVYDMTYKKLLKFGGLFALLHVALGIGYLALLIYVFPA